MSTDSDDFEVFREEQRFDWWVYLVLLFPGSASIVGIALAAPDSGSSIRWWVLALVVLVFLVIANLLWMTTRVGAHTILVTFGLFFPMVRWSIRRAEIASVEAVAYNPIADYGGWGIRGFPFMKRVALNARGHHGVLLTLLDDRTVLLGSQRSDELRQAIAGPVLNSPSSGNAS